MLFAQHGFGKSNKIDRGLASNHLSGIILSPKDETEQNMRNFVQTLQMTNPNIETLFDNQLYHVPFNNANDRNLPSYPYYPGHLSLSAFRGTGQLRKITSNVIDYQDSLGTSYITSPCILISNFTDRETQIVLNLAQDSIDYHRDNRIQNPLVISLLINENAFLDTLQVNQFLNEISVLDATGFYITIARNSPAYNQIFDNKTVLTNILTSIYSLAEINEYKVIMGYSDFVGIPFLSVGAYAIGSGWHNGLRRFTVQQRILPSSGGRQPRHRYSSWPLLNSILMSELDTISNSTTLLPQILSGTSYDTRILTASNPLSAPWDRDTGHMQHWEALCNGITHIVSPHNDISSKLDAMQQTIANALGLYSLLNASYVPLEHSSQPHHLTIWNDSINDFRKQANV
ncbi:hypothetical protein [Xylanibacillus composti]|uniref:Uncharacterized protein n=1 Tax=Xylanibacillus composti TaxID=1572762 RepID=A0A8J4M504_9BACL|nr:hypothetical protein [Xylanibacillus composti]GIQ71496.1 hypothetical protein XYCOK13_43200 [Xylanibacillus composti]